MFCNYKSTLSFGAVDACDKLMLLSILAHFPIRSNEVFNESCTSVLSVDKIRKTEGSKYTCQCQRGSCVWNLPYRGLLAATLSSKEIELILISGRCIQKQEVVGPKSANTNSHLF